MTEVKVIMKEAFTKIRLNFDLKEYSSLYVEKNNKTLRETLKHKRYAKLSGEVDQRYKTYLDLPLGEFLQILKNNNDSFYKRFLNKYGDETYCRFVIKDSRILNEKGIYAYWIDCEIMYVGRCLDSFKKRINQGYGKIHPKNCFIDGQATNCHLNSLISKHKDKIEFGVLILQDDVEIEAKEAQLIAALKPRWNIQLGSPAIPRT